jgi:hypothetical protein
MSNGINPRRPFAWREFLIQSWFVARVSGVGRFVAGLTLLTGPMKN